MTTMLEYGNFTQSNHEPEGFVLRVPLGIRSKGDLFAALADIGRFPGHFGSNWNALLDCLRDLSWITNRKVVILHSDLPLQDNPSECRIYLEILQIALADWLKPSKPEPNMVESPFEWPYVEHELRVVFPIETRATVVRLVELI
jgi:hypothetical protein